MYAQPKLSDEEWDLVVELLECERRELPAEIHHTRTESVRKDLQHRSDVVQRLLVKLGQMESAMV